MRSNYNTKQKDIIMSSILDHHNRFTAKDIYDDVKDTTGLTTVYRVIDKLVNEGKISKYLDDNNNSYYVYLEECNLDNHFFLRCDKCGSVIHIDCDCIKELSEHISKDHKFKINNEHIMINGICNSCIRK